MTCIINYILIYRVLLYVTKRRAVAKLWPKLSALIILINRAPHSIAIERPIDLLIFEA